MRTNMLFLLKCHFTLLILFLITLMPVEAQEEADTSRTEKVITLDDIIVTAERTPVQACVTGRDVKVIRGDEVKSFAVQSLTDILEYETNTDIRQRGSGGVQSDISIRGSSFEQTLIMLNGINISDPQTGHHNMNLPVDPDDIERIEILKGSGSRSFGPNAFGGVINIITRHENTHKASVKVSAGGFGYFNAGFAISIPTSFSSNYLAVSHQKSDGYTDNTDYCITNLYFNNRIETGAFLVEFQTGLSIRNFGANSFYTPRFPDQYEQIRTLITGISLKKIKGDIGVSSNIYWRRNQDQFALFRNQFPSWYKNDNFHLTNVAGGGCTVSYNLPVGTLSSGVDVRYEKILSNVLGETLSNPFKIPWNDSVNFTNGHIRFHSGLFLEYSLTTGRFHATAGTMAAFNSDNPGKLSLYPGVDISYRFLKGFILFGSVNRALRLPSFTDLYYSSPVLRGNRNLMPEKAVSIESGIKLTRGWINAQVVMFRRIGIDIIDWVKFPYDSVWLAMNHTHLNIRGFEFNIRWRSPVSAEKKTCFEKFMIGYSFTDAGKESGEMQSRYVLDELRHKADLGASWKIAGVVSTGLQMSYQQRAGGYQPYENGQYLPEVPFSPVLLMDGKISWKFCSCVIYAEATNILNIEYFDHVNVPAPGRMLKAGIKMDITELTMAKHRSGK